MIVYTAIFGRYDTLHPPLVINPNWHYFCISEHTWDVPEPWQVIERPLKGDYRRSARYYKINSHLTFPMAQLTVWHGGNVQLTVDPEELEALLGKTNIAACKHSERDCAYREAGICAKWGLDDKHILSSQTMRYTDDGFPRNWGLYGTYLMVRQHTDEVKQLNTLWWGEVNHSSVRDQVSFPYAVWKTGSKVAIIPGDHRSGPHFKRYRH